MKGVVGKLTQGAADAGFVYASDVKAAGGELEGDRAARRRSQPTGDLRRRRGQGRRAARRGEGVRRRPARRRLPRRAARRAGFGEPP